MDSHSSLTSHLTTHLESELDAYIHVNKILFNLIGSPGMRIEQNPSEIGLHYQLIISFINKESEYQKVILKCLLKFSQAHNSKSLWIPDPSRMFYAK